MSFSSLRSSNLLHGDVSSKQCGRNYHHSHHKLAVEVRFFQCPREPLSQVVSIYCRRFGPKCSKYSGSVAKTIYSRRFGPKCSKCSGSVAKTIYSRGFVSKCSKYSGSVARTILEETRFSEPRNDNDYGHGGGGDGDSYGGDGGGSGSGSGSGNGGGGGGGDDKEGEGEEEEFGPIMKFEEVMKVAEGRGVKLPSEMVEAAKSTGIRKAFLFRYLDLQGSVWPLGFLMKHCAMLRNRMLVDPSFLFKVGTEIVIDSCCATFAEVQKRGKDFWTEFELYAADLLVGVAVDIALVGLLAPYARIGKPSVSKGLLGRIQQATRALPSSVFEAETPGCKFTVKQRVATFFYKGVLYGSVGFGCGLIGQGIANVIMNAKRSIKKSEEDIPVPPLLGSAALWGVFLGVSSNARYQIINGLERLVETSPLAKQVPPVALAFTVGVRFGNNIYGGMQFVDWAKWSGVQ